MLLFFHLKNLGFKIFYYFGIVILLSLIGYSQKLVLFKIILAPIQIQTEYLICIDPLEATWTSLFISWTFATWSSFPILFILLGSYITTSLYRHEFVSFIFIGSKYGVLLYLSSLIIYYSILPIILYPIFAYTSPFLKMEIRIWSFCTFFFLIFVILLLNCFLPFILYDFRFSSSTVSKGRTIYLLLSTLLITLIVPTDREFFLFLLINFLLYEITIFTILCRENSFMGSIEK
jgi:Sec-independent protein secretion pathway component TatC